MKKVLENGILPSGLVRLPPSKSEAIRAAVLAKLAGGEPGRVLDGFQAPYCDDIENALSALGSDKPCVMESAFLLRVLLPVLLVKSGEAELTVGTRLLERGFSELTECLGVTKEVSGNTIRMSGFRAKSEYRVNCSRSSQFLSGLLIALPLLPVPSEIIITGGLVSKPYADMTLRFVRLFGGRVRRTDSGFYVEPSRYSMPESIPVTGDESLAAVYRAMNFLGADIEIEGGSESTLQPDRVFPKLVNETDCSIKDCPDLLPVLAACACARRGDTVIRGTLRLRSKESDREAGVVRMITDLGGSAEAFDDAVVIHGTGRLSGGSCSSLSDHRLAFMAAVLALISDAHIVLDGAECVNKSAPLFWEELERLNRDG